MPSIFDEPLAVRHGTLERDPAIYNMMECWVCTLPSQAANGVGGWYKLPPDDTYKAVFFKNVDGVAGPSAIPKPAAASS